MRGCETLVGARTHVGTRFKHTRAREFVAGWPDFRNLQETKSKNTTPILPILRTHTMTEPATVLTTDSNSSPDEDTLLWPSNHHQDLTMVPPNALSGGTWGVQTYRGAISAVATVGGVLLCFIPGLLDVMLLSRWDRRTVYLAPDGVLYNGKGRVVGQVGDQNQQFRPYQPRAVIVDGG